MQLGFKRDNEVNIIIVSGSCCLPGMVPLDAEARRNVEEAIAESGVVANVKEIPVSNLFFAGLHVSLMRRLTNMVNQSGLVGLPVVLVNGKEVGYGVPSVDDIKKALTEVVGPASQPDK